MNRPVLSPAAVEYPSGDGQPMAENDWQLHAIIDTITALKRHFAHRADVYVSGDLFIYYEEGNPRARVAPDVFVVFGVPDRKRPIYKLWEEGEVPAFVMEVASVSTWREDDRRKAALYERLGVREYWQYDPTGEYLGLQLKGRRLAGGMYVPQPVVESLDGTLLLGSETLGIEMRVKGEEMRFRDPATGQDVLSLREEHAARRAAEVEAERPRPAVPRGRPNAPPPAVPPRPKQNARPAPAVLPKARPNARPRPGGRSASRSRACSERETRLFARSPERRESLRRS